MGKLNQCYQQTQLEEEYLDEDYDKEEMFIDDGIESISFNYQKDAYVKMFYSAKNLI